MPLHPKLRERIDYESSTFPNLLELPIPEARRVVREAALETDRLAGSPSPLDRVEDHSVPLPGRRVGVRLYFPRDSLAPFSSVAYFHGGGWVFGDLETHDSVCREIAARARAVVVSVDYRRSPEAKFPAALEDCYGVVQWLDDPTTRERFGLRRGNLVVAGDSAGGNMAAVVAAQARDLSGPRLTGQVLICPVAGYEPATPSYHEFASGFGLEASFMPWMWTQYLNSPQEGRDPRVAPLRAANFSGLPPGLVITAEYDVLRDEGEQYAERLAQSGVRTHSTRYRGMVHGFLDYRGLVPEGWDAINEIADTLRGWFA